MPGRPGFITDPQHVAAVLLQDGQWYNVVPGSFQLGTWEVGSAGTGQYGGVEAARLAFRFTLTDGGGDVVGAIAGLAAVRVAQPESPSG